MAHIPAAGLTPLSRNELPGDADSEPAVKLLLGLLPDDYTGVSACREALEQAGRNLEERFRRGEPV
ncbi:MAG TPA: hypothetical protein VFZ51_03255, partial [Woeseiaceae bacterium]